MHAELEEKLLGIIERRLGDAVSRVEIKSIEIKDDLAEVHIVLHVEMASTVAELAGRYFGLTDRVRDGLGDRFEDYFPVITPHIDVRQHA